MEPRPQASYLKLAQFLDLESRWLGAPDKVELCHRICRTIVFVLETPAVAIGLSRGETPYAIVATAGDWPKTPGDVGLRVAGAARLAQRARETGTAQLKSIGEDAVGIFPFAADDDLTGCLHVRIGRPVFDGDEVAFLRFVASLCGIVLAGGAHLAEQPTQTAATAGAGAAEAAPDATRRRLAMVAHDLRNPLSVLSGYVDLMAQGGLGELSDQQMAAGQAMQRQIDVLANAIDKLMELDRTKGAETANGSSFELRELFDELAETRFPHAADRVTWPGPEAAFEFDTDRHRLTSIVQNLVDNALRHGGEGRVVVDCSRRRRQLLIRVCDQGPGLTREQASALEARSSGIEPHPAGPVAGLGLLAVGEHVAALGGKIEVSTDPGRPGTISLQIPARRSAGQDPSARTA